MAVSQLPDGCNYIEYYVYELVKDGFVDVNIDEDKYQQLMKNVAMHNYKYFGRQYKTYYHNDLVYENHGNSDIKVYSKPVIDYKIDESIPILALYCSKDKKPFHTFPATHDIQNISHVKKLVFRVHNRLYINFETQVNHNYDQVKRKVYINYNHDRHIDTEFMSELIEKVIISLLG